MAESGVPVSRVSGSRVSGSRVRRRRLRWRIVVLGIVVALAGAAVVGDKIAARYATNELRTRLVSELSRLDVQYESLDVAIGGFPFLTQVARGSYEEITIDMLDVRLPDNPDKGVRSATLPTLQVVADGVDADTRKILEGKPKVNARQVTGTATVSFRTLETIIDYGAYGLSWLSEVTYAEVDGAVHATGMATVVGLRLPISAVADISVVEGQIQVRLRDIKAVNVSLPPAATESLNNAAQRSIPAQLIQLPFGLTLDRVTVEPSGLVLVATGQDVALLT